MLAQCPALAHLKFTYNVIAGRDDPKRCNQIKIMPFIQTCLAQSQSASPKATTLYVEQHVALSCGLSAKQMAKRKQCKVPTKQGQRLDHTTKLAASLARQCRCYLTMPLSLS